MQTVFLGLFASWAPNTVCMYMVVLFLQALLFKSLRNPSALGLLFLDAIDVDVYLAVVEASKADDTQ